MSNISSLEAKREAIEAEERAKAAAEKRARERKSVMQWDSLGRAAGGEGGEGEAFVDPDALPEPDPDTKAYFRELAEKIEELEELGHGAGGRGMYGGGAGGEDDEEEQEDDRPLLLRSALEGLNGHEIPLAGDGETSVILERLLHAMDDFARRVLADRFAGSYPKLVKHRAASHVLQTLFTLAGETVDRETRGIVATSPNGEDTSLPTMTTLLLSTLTEIVDSLPNLIYDPFGSHTLRVLLRVFSGLPPPPTDGRLNANAERSKKSQKWRKGQKGIEKNFLADGSETSSGIEGKKRRVPKEFGEALVQMWESLNGLDEGGPKGEGVRRAALDPIAGPAVRVMIEMEAAEETGWTPGGWADRVMCGLVEEVADPSTKTEERTELRSEYLGGLLRSPASSPTFETLLLKSSPAMFDALWDALFVGKLHRLAGNQVANFVVAVGITRLSKEQLSATVQEVVKIGTERRGEWIDNFRTGVLRNLLERAAELKACEAEMLDVMLDTFGLKENKDLVVPCLLSLNRLEYYKKLPSHVTAQPATQGSVLLQSWLKLSSPHQQVVIDSINSLGVPGITTLTRDATSSRVLDALLSSPTTPAREKRKFLMSLIGHYHLLADDRLGSRVVERCWEAADVFLKDKIAASLVDHANFLQASAYGHFFARKLELPLWQRRRADWKAKMAAAAPGRKMEDRPAVVHDEPKKRERPVDEVDEIFSRKKGKASEGGPAAPVVNVEVPKREVKKVEGLEDVFGALKASVK
ncbi:rRNA processing protein Nop9 [Pseudohyphozyma bogoriensis]|nr:rRNA processing protein Nop9 [Pseudohyphozyma bogoriensis]